MQNHTLIVLGGFAGAGKTTVAQKLSSEFNLPLIGTDELNTALRNAQSINFHDASPCAHDIAWSLVRDYLKNKVTVIIDTNMCRAKTWENLDAVRKDFPGLNILPIILECSIETHKKRIDHRGATQPDHLNLGGDKLEDVLSKYEFIRDLDRSDLIRMNTEKSADDVYTDVISLLREHNVLSRITTGSSSPQSL